MSDRYETPSWDDEPGDLTGGRDAAGAADEAAGSASGDPDLEASSENVLDGWPAADVVTTAGADASQDAGTDSEAPATSR